MKKRLLFFLSFILITVFLCGFDSEERKVYDEADLLSEQEEEELQELLVQLAVDAEQDLIVVTTNDNAGKSSQDYADDFYDDHGFGYERKNGSGILLLLNMDDREVYISTAGTAQEKYTDDEIDSTLDVLIPYMKSENYMGACTSFAETAVRCLKGGQTADNGYYDPETDRFVSTEKTGWQKVFSPGRILVNLLIAFAVSVVVVFCIAHNRKTKMSVGSGTYLKDGKLGFRDRGDRFTHTTVVTRHIPKNDGGSGSSGGGGGHSSTHVSSGGHSHGGGGRGF